jgi:hypothetical protein
MNVNTETPRREFTVQGVTLTIQEPFVEGHTVTAGEASALNQLLVENSRNNLADEVKEMKEAGKDPSEMQLVVDQYVAEYEFGVRRPGSRTSDPVEAAANEVAFELAKKFARKAGKTLKEIGNEQLRKDADELLADSTLGPRIRAKAEQIAAARALGDLDL